MRKRWDITTAAGYGAIIGALYSILREAFDSPVGLSQQNPTYLGGLLVGGAIGGLLLFSIVAWARNRITRSG